MRIAVISDIHGNLEALETALEHIRQQGVGRLYCLGDIVGYGANPSECLDLVREHCSGIIVGNHDEAAYCNGAENAFSEVAFQAIRWTREQLGAEQLAFLKSLPFRMAFQDMMFVHASPSHPEAWKYIFGSMDALSQKSAFTERVCFVGHSHIPGVYSLSSQETGYNNTDRFIINVGSIGQPRDRDPRLSYGLLDTFAGTYENIRLKYDMKTAAGKIRKAKLPEYLATRLIAGR